MTKYRDIKIEDKRTERFGLIISPRERCALARLSTAEGGLSAGALIRKLIRNAARERGLWPTLEQVQEYEPGVNE